jgi:hypothetical protein
VTDKYLTTQALEWFHAVRHRFWNWLSDEEPHYRRLTIIGSFVFGAVVVRIEPDVFLYAATSAGMLTMLLFAISFLIPVAYLVEWTLRPLFE